MSKVKVRLQNNTGKDLNFQFYLGNTYLDAGKSKEATIEAGKVKASHHGKVLWEGNVSSGDEGSTIVIS
jgi:hypothetical protein